MNDIDKLKAAMNSLEGSNKDIERLQEAMNQRQANPSSDISRLQAAQRERENIDCTYQTPARKMTYLQAFRAHRTVLSIILVVMLLSAFFLPVMTMSKWAGWIVGLLNMVGAGVLWAIGTALYLRAKVRKHR